MTAVFMWLSSYGHSLRGVSGFSPSRHGVASLLMGEYPLCEVVSRGVWRDSQDVR